jgi:uncharacterized protein
VPVSEAEQTPGASEAPAEPAAPEEVHEAEEPAATSEPHPTSIHEALAIAAAVTIASGAAVSFAFSEERAGTPWMLGSIGLVYGILGVVTITRLHRRDELHEQLRPRGGDLTIGALVAAVLYGVAMAAHALATSPPSPRAGWIVRIYACLGDPTAEGRHLVGGVVFLIAAFEELVWRGLVMRTLNESLGWLRSWGLQALLFGVAHVPTMFLLGDPKAGPNPLLVAAGVAYSLVWGRLAMRFDRLPPALFAHALFTWAVFEFPIWRP